MSHSASPAEPGTSSAADTEREPDEAPDPRGWRLVSADSVRVGEVCNVVRAQGPDHARYLECELDADVLDLHDDRLVLVPLSETRMDTAAEQVLALRLTRDDLMHLPDGRRRRGEPRTRFYDAVLGSARVRPPHKRRGAGWPAVGYGDDI